MTKPNGFGNVLGMRELTMADLERLRKVEKRTKGSTITVMRERYHALARLLAVGHPLAEAARMLRMSYQNAWVINQDPMFMEAVAEAQDRLDKEVYSDHRRTLQLMETAKLMAWQQLVDQLEDAENGGDKIPPKTLVTIAADASDRTGHAKVQVNIQHDGDIAAKIDLARARSAKVLNLRGRSFPAPVMPAQLEPVGTKGREPGSGVPVPRPMRRP